MNITLLKEDEKPVCALIADGQRLLFTHIFVDITVGYRERQYSWFETPPSFIERERWEEGDSLIVELKGLYGEYNLVSAVDLLGKKVKLENLAEEFPYNKVNLESGEYFIDYIHAPLYQTQDDKVKINLRHLGQLEYSLLTC